jgi:hypothetical protein
VLLRLSTGPPLVGVMLTKAVSTTPDAMKATSRRQRTVCMQCDKVLHPALSRSIFVAEASWLGLLQETDQSSIA